MKNLKEINIEKIIEGEFRIYSKENIYLGKVDFEMYKFKSSTYLSPIQMGEIKKFMEEHIEVYKLWKSDLSEKSKEKRD